MPRKKRATKPKAAQARDYIERGETHDIDERAKKIFQFMIPVHWIINELPRDYGKDYHVEISDSQTNGAVRGKVFYVQLKGHDKCNYGSSNTIVKQSLQLRYLQYYSAEVSQPVFLVVVNIGAKEGYWLFVQEYLNKNMAWKSQNPFTLHIPISNRVSDYEKFEKEVERSIKYMRARLAPVHEVLAAKIESLQ